MFRFEMHNDLKRAKINSLKSLSMIHGGIAALGEEALKGSDSESIRKFNCFKTHEAYIVERQNES